MGALILITVMLLIAAVTVTVTDGVRLAAAWRAERQRRAAQRVLLARVTEWHADLDGRGR